MAQLQSHHVFRRDVNTDPNSPDYCPSWYYCSTAAYIIKWVVVAAIALLIVLYVGGSLYHARRRMAKGLPPLRYHRWLVSRYRLNMFAREHPQNSSGFYRPGYGPDGQIQSQGYNMHNYGYAPPPPAYNEGEAVPVYTPPSKVDPDQSYAVPPPGAPAGYNQNAGSSNVIVPPSQPLRAASAFNSRER